MFISLQPLWEFPPISVQENKISGRWSDKVNQLGCAPLGCFHSHPLSPFIITAQCKCGYSKC